MLGGGPFDLRPGQWTDDTAMALALADSLISCASFDPNDLATRFVRWWQEGAYSCTGTCFDIGITTREALARFVRTSEPYAGSAAADTAGNGSLMRLAPVALYALHDAAQADQLARDQSRITHAAPEAIEAAPTSCGSCATPSSLIRCAPFPDLVRRRRHRGHRRRLLASEVTQTRSVRPATFIEHARSRPLGCRHHLHLREALSSGRSIWLKTPITVGAVTGSSQAPLRCISHPESAASSLAWQREISRAADRLLIKSLRSSSKQAFHVALPPQGIGPAS